MKKRPSARHLLDFAIATDDHDLAALIITTASLDYLVLLQQQQDEPLDIPAALSALSHIMDPQLTPVPARS
jgi:hypothetical protein